MPVAENIIVEFSKVSPTDAVKDLEGKGLVITKTSAETRKAVEQRLFAITQSVNMEVLQDTREAIAKAIKDGLPFKTFQSNIQNILASKGWTGERIIKLPDGAKKLLTTKPARLKLIYENALSTSLNAGRFKRFADNSDDRPYLELHELQDSRSRKKHRQKSGTIAHITALVWKSPFSWVPPNGHRCRGWITALTTASAKARGIKVKKPGTIPDPGFGFNSASSWFKPKKKDFDPDIWEAGQRMEIAKVA